MLCNRIPYRCEDPTQTAAFVYVRTRNTVTGRATPWVLIQRPPFVCLGPGTPTVPIEDLIAEQLAEDFEDLPVPRADIIVSPPNRRTLVRVETRFHTTLGTRPLPSVDLLGKTVTVTVAPSRYDWFWGDGKVSRNVGPGTEASPIVHRYETAGTFRAYVTIGWKGTFQMEGDPRTFQIDGSVTIPGFPTDVEVFAPRSELVAR